MNIDEIIEDLSKASIYDLYRIQVYIGKIMEDPKKIEEVRRKLIPGKVIEYFLDKEERLVPAKILLLKRTRVLVEDLEDKKRWDLPFYLIKLDDKDKEIDSASINKSLPLKYQFKVNDKVGFKDSQNQDKYGSIVKLNQKTASIILDDGQNWRVSYRLLFPLIETTVNQKMLILTDKTSGVLK